MGNKTSPSLHAVSNGMEHQHHHDLTDQKKSALIGLKKAQSLITKIVKMAEDDKYCIDIMQQNLAVIGLIKAANKTLMEGHLSGCFKSAISSSQNHHKEEMIKEILTVTNLSNK